MTTSNKVVLVTGCSEGGIGFALCEAYAAQGCVVYATARRLESMQKLSDSNIHTLKLDVLLDADVEDVVSSIVNREGRIDILVNNAGAATPGAVLDSTVDRVRAAFELNTISVFRVSKAVARYMAQRKSGTIVVIGSVAGIVPTPWGGIYPATKAAVHMMMDILWMECKPLGIHVTVVAAGGVKTNIAKNAAQPNIVPEDTLYSAYTSRILSLLPDSQAKMHPDAPYSCS
ncbi:hypothetical protein QCA50_010318 [Cerrena zonata]|uniref:NAD(P)-binding protein n=1 Tax=Cerrena zonata TaxID=2478898 RepID=A0AAW0G9V2_9APHY